MQAVSEGGWSPRERTLGRARDWVLASMVRCDTNGNVSIRSRVYLQYVARQDSPEGEVVPVFTRGGTAGRLMSIDMEDDNLPRGFDHFGCEGSRLLRLTHRLLRANVVRV